MRKTVVSLSRNQVVTLKRKVVVTLNGISNIGLKRERFREPLRSYP